MPARPRCASSCTYRTKKKGFRNLKLQLELTIQPVTDQLRSKLQSIPFEDGSRLQDLGDEAYVDKFDLGRCRDGRAPR